MKNWILILLVFCSLLSFGQRKKVKIYTLENLINTAMTGGMSKFEGIADPIDLILVDSTASRKFIDIEFKIGFCRKNQDLQRLYEYFVPETTKEIADKYNDRYACEKLFEYYKKIPKFVYSDTLYHIYDQFDDFLKTLVFFRPKGLRERLIKDYYQWKEITKKGSPKVYPDYKKPSTMSFMESHCIKKSDLYPDCNLILLYLAQALNDLKVSGFNDQLIERLKKIQSYPFVENIGKINYFDHISYRENLNKRYNSNKVSYANIDVLIKDFKGFEKLMELMIFGWRQSLATTIVYSKNNRAWIDVSFNNGSTGYVISLNNHILKAETIWQIEE